MRTRKARLVLCTEESRPVSARFTGFASRLLGWPQMLRARWTALGPDLPEPLTGVRPEPREVSSPAMIECHAYDACSVSSGSVVVLRGAGFGELSFFLFSWYSIFFP